MKLQYRDLENAVIAGLGLPDTRRKPLRSKVQHLQLVGLIERHSEGRGRHAVYSILEAQKILACFLLIEMQWPAKTAAAFVQENWGAFAQCLKEGDGIDADQGPVVLLQRTVFDEKTLLTAQCVSRERLSAEILRSIGGGFSTRTIIDLLEVVRASGLLENDLQES